MGLPNLFIVGAPKCGTTSLAGYLSTHPNTYFSRVKEPHFFCTDITGKRKIETNRQYLSLFKKAAPTQFVVGEASTHYLRSEVAIANILTFNPDSKFVAMLRNPVDLVYSYHQQLLFGFQEDVSDFELAWRMQDRRSTGQCLPRTCRVPSNLQYGKIGKLGEQVERLFRHAGRERTKLVLFDDFSSDAKQVYEDVLTFLELPSDRRTHFGISNAGKVHRWPRISNLIMHPPFPLNLVKSYAKHCVGRNMSTLYNKLSLLSPRAPLRVEFVEELVAFFRKDIVLLQELLERDLSHWLEPVSVDQAA